MSKYQKIVDLRNMYLIKKSGYFDDNYYKLEYPEVVGNRLKHYYYKGYKKGYNPSSIFDNDFYLNNNTDVYKENINPLLHYIVSGINEGRQIKKVSGMKISTLYSSLENKKYKFHAFLENEVKERLTIFLNNKDNTDTLIKIVEKMKNINIRIIYESIDIEKFTQFIKTKKINIDNIELDKWNASSYIKIRKNEKVLCLDYDTLTALLNTLYIKRPIYYYIDKNIDTNSNEYKWLSYYVTKEKVVLVSNDTLILEKYKLIVENNIKTPTKSNIKIGFKFKKISIPMLQVLEDYFLIYNTEKNLSFYYTSNNIQKDLCFINEKKIKYVPSLNETDITINFENKESDQINIYFEKNNDKMPIIKIEELDIKEGDKNV